jgi:hypothetical protein
VTSPITDESVAARVFRDWHEFAKSGRVDDLLALYAEDAVLESPLVPAILDTDTGVCRGRGEIARFLGEGTRRRPNELVRWHRRGQFLWDGSMLSWEYTRETPDGDQVDIAEHMDLDSDGLIRRHRIYWGWFGVRQLLDSARRGPE